MTGGAGVPVERGKKMKHAASIVNTGVQREVGGRDPAGVKFISNYIFSTKKYEKCTKKNITPSYSTVLCRIFRTVISYRTLD